MSNTHRTAWQNALSRYESLILSGAPDAEIAEALAAFEAVNS